MGASLVIAGWRASYLLTCLPTGRSAVKFNLFPLTKRHYYSIINSPEKKTKIALQRITGLFYFLQAYQALGASSAASSVVSLTSSTIFQWLIQRLPLRLEHSFNFIQPHQRFQQLFQQFLQLWAQCFGFFLEFVNHSGGFVIEFFDYVFGFVFQVCRNPSLSLKYYSCRFHITGNIFGIFLCRFNAVGGFLSALML
ncbi:MAG: hypothetical protein IPH20_20905 [Bacteroidales bacterium]|nr:hypothetical protein [Bacteroidales bacterium]